MLRSLHLRASEVSKVSHPQCIWDNGTVYVYYCIYYILLRKSVPNGLGHRLGQQVSQNPHRLKTSEQSQFLKTALGIGFGFSFCAELNVSAGCCLLGVGRNRACLDVCLCLAQPHQVMAFAVQIGKCTGDEQAVGVLGKAASGRISPPVLKTRM
jgi:hypothetical protein